MPINLQSLQASLAKVGEIAYDEISFDAGEHRVTLRPVKAWEAQESDHYSRIAWEGRDSDDAAAFGEFLDRTRVSILSHSIIEFDGIDLRDVTYIDAGESTPDGKPVQVEKHKAIRDAIYEWPRQVLHRAYLKYTEMMQRVEVKAQAAIEIEVKDIDAEIDRLEERLGNLRAIKEEAEEKADAPEPGAPVREAVAEASRRQHEQVDDLVTRADTADFKRQAAEAEAAATHQAQPMPPSYPPMQDEAAAPQPTRDPRPGTRQPIIPQRGTAPPREAAQPPPPRQEPEPPPVQTDARGIPLPHEGDSFMDSAEPEEALRAEEARQRAFRAQRQGQQPRQPQEPVQGTIAPPVARGEPPHAAARRQALNQENATLDLRGEAVSTGRVDPRTGEEIAAVRLPTDVVSEDQRGVPATPKKQEVRASLNQRGTGTGNPKFVAPGGQQQKPGQAPKVWRDER